MFTGIIKGKFPVVSITDREGLRSFVVAFSPEYVEGLATGASVAIDGVCFTATQIEGTRVSFDAMEETLKKTTIGKLKEGDNVNIERSARMGDEIGGHVMSGHVSTMAEIVAVNDLGSLENLAYLLTYDSVYGRAPFAVEGNIRHS